MATEISDVRMKAVDNGVIISYSEMTRNGKKGTFDNCQHKYPEIAIQRLENESADDMIDRAGDEFLKLFKQQYNSKGSNGPVAMESKSY